MKKPLETTAPSIWQRRWGNGSVDICSSNSFEPWPIPSRLQHFVWHMFSISFVLIPNGEWGWTKSIHRQAHGSWVSSDNVNERHCIRFQSIGRHLCIRKQEFNDLVIDCACVCVCASRLLNGRLRGTLHNFRNISNREWCSCALRQVMCFGEQVIDFTDTPAQFALVWRNYGAAAAGVILFHLHRELKSFTFLLGNRQCFTCHSHRASTCSISWQQSVPHFT